MRGSVIFCLLWLTWLIKTGVALSETNICGHIPRADKATGVEVLKRRVYIAQSVLKTDKWLPGRRLGEAYKEGRLPKSLKVVLWVGIKSMFGGQIVHMGQNISLDMLNFKDILVRNNTT